MDGELQYLLLWGGRKLEWMNEFPSGFPLLFPCSPWSVAQHAAAADAAAATLFWFDHEQMINKNHLSSFFQAFIIHFQVHDWLHPRGGVSAVHADWRGSNAQNARSHCTAQWDSLKPFPINFSELFLDVYFWLLHIYSPPKMIKYDFQKHFMKNDIANSFF